MAEFSIFGTKYRSVDLDSRDQIKVVKRLARIAPALKTLAGLAKGLKPVGDQAQPGDQAAVPSVSLSPEDLSTLVESLTTAVADMPDDDLFFVIDSCLKVTERFDGTGWPRVMTQSGVPMFPLKMTETLAVTFYVLQANLGQLSSFAKLSQG